MLLKPIIIPRWYKPFEEDDSEFLIEPLSDMSTLTIQSIITFDKDGSTTLDAEACKALLIRGLKGWKNVYDKEGDKEEAPFINSHRAIERMPHEYITMIAVEIWNITKITPEDKKKSQSQSGSQKTETSTTAQPAT